MQSLTGMNDIILDTTEIRIIPDFPLALVTFTLRVDGISQEADETFKFSFANLQLSNSGLFPTLPISIGEMNGTIVDSDCELIYLVQVQLRAIWMAFCQYQCLHNASIA